MSGSDVRNIKLKKEIGSVSQPILQTTEEDGDKKVCTPEDTLNPLRSLGCIISEMSTSRIIGFCHQIRFFLITVPFDFIFLQIKRFMMLIFGSVILVEKIIAGDVMIRCDHSSLSVF
jgi:hypothetical protein